MAPRDESDIKHMNFWQVWQSIYDISGMATFLRSQVPNFLHLIRLRIRKRVLQMQGKGRTATWAERTTKVWGQRH